MAFVSRNFLCSLILLMLMLSIECHDILMLLLPSTLHFVPITFFSIRKLPHATHSTKRKHVECVQNLFCIFIQSFAARLPFSETDLINNDDDDANISLYNGFLQSSKCNINIHRNSVNFSVGFFLSNLVLMCVIRCCRWMFWIQ